MNTDKSQLRAFINLHNILIRLRVGLLTVINNPLHIFFLILLICIIMFNTKGYDSSFDTALLCQIDETLYSCIIYISILSSIAIYLFLASRPLQAWNWQKNFIRAGIVNHMGESPILISQVKQYNKERNINVYELTFDMCGISLDEWKDKILLLENALNIVISDIKQGKNRREIVMYAVSGNYHFPERLEWKKEFFNMEKPIIVLGESMGRMIEWNLKVIPHMLLGGATGTGKSVLLKLILMQAIHKCYTVYLADFKGGVDYNRVWHEKCHFVTEQESLLLLLEELVNNLHTRTELLITADVRNIDEYNEQFPDIAMPRIVFACDELAELLDKTGKNKNEKEMLAQIESNLSTIARLGRASGIHLILTTQRPDANILSGQIKNNLEYRVCGRADNVLSVIILDNGDAADMIPKDEQGVFLNHEGILFKGFIFDERKELVNY